MRRGKLPTKTAALCLAAWLAISAPIASAETGVTNVIDGTTVNAGSGYIVGNGGSFNALTITNAGVLNVTGGDGTIGGGGNGNTVFVTGSGSVWSNSNRLILGNEGADNRLIIENGGRVISSGTGVGESWRLCNNNVVIVSGTGSVFNSGDRLDLSQFGRGNNQLRISNGGLVTAGNVTVGEAPQFPSDNGILVSGGSLNVAGSFWVRHGSLTINDGGLVTADTFAADQSGNAVVNLNSGILSVGAAVVDNGAPFVIGDGVNSAALMLNSGPSISPSAAGPVMFLSPGVSSFANDLVVRNNAALALFARANVGGNYIQNSGSALMVGFGGTSPGQYGYLNIAGTASLAGLMEAYSFGGFTPTDGMQITFLHAAGGYAGSFSGFSNQTAMAASIIYPNANDVAVRWSQTPFGSYALTPGQSAVGGALDRDVSNPRMGALINLLNSLPVGALPAAMESLSPQQLTAMSQGGAGAANVQAANVQSRFGALRGGVGGGFSSGFSLFDPSGMMDWIDRQPRFASMLPAELELAMSKEALASGILRRSAENPWGVFVEGAGQFVGVDSIPTASGYHVTTAGMTVGIDRQVLDAASYPHDQLVVGVALGYANSTSYLTGDGRVDINGAQGTLYGAWFKDGWHVEAAGGGGANLYDTRRQVLGQTARGDTQGHDAQGMLSGGYDWKAGGWTFGPRVTVQYTTVEIDGFTESGSLAPLTVGSQSMDSLLTQAGAHLARTFEAGKTLWTPELRLGWQHESMDSVTAVDAQFANGSGNIFSSQSVPLGRDAMVAGVGLAVQWSKALTTYINYGTELMRDNYSVHNVNAGVRFSF